MVETHSKLLACPNPKCRAPLWVTLERIDEAAHDDGKPCPPVCRAKVTHDGHVVRGIEQYA